MLFGENRRKAVLFFRIFGIYGYERAVTRPFCCRKSVIGVP